MKAEESGKRMCRKCLSAEMDQASYFASMHTYIANLDEEIKTKQEEYARRLKCCKQCDLLTDAMCRACGCFVEMRGAIATNSCPYDKW